MDVFINSLYAPPLIAGTLMVLIGAAIAVVVFRNSKERGMSITFTVVFVGILAGFVSGSWSTAHNEGFKDRSTLSFEKAYDLTIIEGEVPLGDEPFLTALTVYLNDHTGPQACLLETTPIATYELTCNGEMRKPNNG